MIKRLILIVIPFIILACGNKEKRSKQVSIEPSEEIINSISKNDFSIILDDMKITEEDNVINHQHKYKVLEMKGDSLYSTSKQWKSVNKSFFLKHENDLGMEIISKHDNKISRVAKPVGFGWAIGNESHGEWEEQKQDSTKTTSSTNRRWRTHSTSPFFWYWLGTRRSVYRNDYNSYRTYNNSSKSYYGNKTSSNKYNYGTRSDYQKKRRSSFFTRKSKNSSRWNTLRNKSKRNSSRYNNGSSTRSRSGGTGK
ncbi:hypothetical protein [uncultured Lacinutrix sp.]|uniref:hypothetical protein n=1 Tax=uncultured Lacinutrix sp. TaxID=574032 RepID=UPI0026343D23|nr:hypothetical protein [uncultured Lacinutrix sp.]